jgi:putative ABC transport system substrate-binding protein
MHHDSDMVEGGGLLSYTAYGYDKVRLAATYVGRILPTHFKMVLNLKTAKALGLTVPLSILVRATEVIE